MGGKKFQKVISDGVVKAVTERLNSDEFKNQIRDSIIEQLDERIKIMVRKELKAIDNEEDY